MPRVKLGGRLGEFSRATPVVLQEGKAVAEGLTELHARSAPARQLDLALRTLANEAEAPLAVFRQAGLPDRLGDYAIMPDGTCRPLAVRERPGDTKTLIQDLPHEAVGHGPLHWLGERLHPPDSDVGFAARVLRAIEAIRERLKAAAEGGDIEAVRIINEAIWLGMSANALRAEFLDGPAVAASRRQAAHQKAGGLTRGQERRAEAARRIAAWQAEAIRIWAERSDLPTRAVARIVAKRVGGSPHTIRTAIKKVDCEHCTSSND